MIPEHDSTKAIEDAIGALYDIVGFHFRQVKMYTELSVKRDGIFGDAEHRERAKMRLEMHTRFVEQIEHIGETLNDAKLNASYVKHLEARLAEKRIVPILLDRAREEVMKVPMLREPLVWAWNKLTWGV